MLVWGSKGTKMIGWPCDRSQVLVLLCHWALIQKSKESQSEHCWVMSNSLWPLGILQARILESGAVPFSRGSSKPRDWTQVSHIAGGFFTSWATRGAQSHIILNSNVTFQIVRATYWTTFYLTIHQRDLWIKYLLWKSISLSILVLAPKTLWLVLFWSHHSG